MINKFRLRSFVLVQRSHGYLASSATWEQALERVAHDLSVPALANDEKDADLLRHKLSARNHRPICFFSGGVAQQLVKVMQTQRPADDGKLLVDATKEFRRLALMALEKSIELNLPHQVVHVACHILPEVTQARHRAAMMARSAPPPGPTAAASTTTTAPASSAPTSPEEEAAATVAAAVAADSTESQQAQQQQQQLQEPQGPVAEWLAALQVLDEHIEGAKKACAALRATTVEEAVARACERLAAAVREEEIEDELRAKDPSRPRKPMDAALVQESRALAVLCSLRPAVSESMRGLNIKTRSSQKPLELVTRAGVALEPRDTLRLAHFVLHDLRAAEQCEHPPSAAQKILGRVRDYDLACGAQPAFSLASALLSLPAFRSVYVDIFLNKKRRRVTDQPVKWYYVADQLFAAGHRIDVSMLSEEVFREQAIQQVRLLADGDNNENSTSSRGSRSGSSNPPSAKEACEAALALMRGSTPNVRALSLVRDVFLCDLPVRAIVQPCRDWASRRFLLESLNLQRLVDEGLFREACDVLQDKYIKLHYNHSKSQFLAGMARDLQLILEAAHQAVIDACVTREMLYRKNHKSSSSSSSSSTKEEGHDEAGEAEATAGADSESKVDNIELPPATTHIEFGHVVLPLTVNDALSKNILIFDPTLASTKPETTATTAPSSTAAKPAASEEDDDVADAMNEQPKQQQQGGRFNPDQATQYNFDFEQLADYIFSFAPNSVLWRHMREFFRANNDRPDIVRKYINVVRVRRVMKPHVDGERAGSKTLVLLEILLEEYVRDHMLKAGLFLLPSAKGTAPLQLAYRDLDVAVVEKPASFATTASIFERDKRCVVSHAFASPFFRSAFVTAENCSSADSNATGDASAIVTVPTRCGITSRLDKGTAGFVTMALNEDAMCRLRYGQKTIAELGVNWSEAIRRQVTCQRPDGTIPEDQRPEGKSEGKRDGVVVAQEAQGTDSVPLMGSRSGRLWKQYYALVVRTLTTVPTTSGVISAPVHGGQSALTRFKFVRHYANGISLVRCSICTGRRHQIRLHMSSIGCPIVNDVKVAGPAASTGLFDGNQIALHLFESSFVRPSDGERVTVTMPFTKEFAAVLKSLEKASA